MPATESWHVARTLRALELLALGPRSAAEVAEGLMIHPRTARRLLGRLVEEGYLTRTAGPRHRYVCTLRLVAVAGQVVQTTELVQAAEPYLGRLHDETGAAAHVCVPSLVAVLCVLHAAGGGFAPVPSLGESIPCHATAAGKALLAFRPSWRAHVLSRPLEPFTLRTAVEPARIEAEARRTRARGYAVEDDEYRTGEHGIAAPVFDHTGEAVAALGVSGAARQLPRRCVREHGALVAAMAAAASEALGYAHAPGHAAVAHG